MSQHRFFCAFLSLVSLGGSVGTAIVGTAQISHAAEVNSEIQVAQLPAALGNRSISITGTGQASIPADQAVLVLSFYPSGTGIDPNASPAQPQVQPNDISAATAAANSVGVSNANAYPDFTTPGSMRVRLVINQPTQAKLDQAIAAVNTAIIKTNRYMSSGVAVGYGIRDCNAAEATVRQTAMSDANRRAAALAGVSGAQLGEVMSLSESLTWGASYTAACPVADDPVSYADISAGYPFYDPSVPPAVRVVYSLSATYGLR
jgi:hypothetical protein